MPSDTTFGFWTKNTHKFNVKGFAPRLDLKERYKGNIEMAWFRQFAFSNSAHKKVYYK